MQLKSLELIDKAWDFIYKFVFGIVDLLFLAFGAYLLPILGGGVNGGVFWIKIVI